MSLTPVQMWILSTLAVTTILHFSGGLVAAAMYVGDARVDAQIGLNVLAGVLAVAAGRAIHRKSLASWWLLLGWAPTAVGLFLTFGK